MRAARAEAERANRAENEFLSRMSHELRTPLNAILGFAQLLEMEELGAERREALGQIRRAGAHLLELINEVLDLSRIESGAIALSFEAVRLGDAVAEVLSMLAPLAAAEGLTLAHPVAGGDVHARADRQRLKQVLLNLVSNAIKYNRPQGAVRVRYGEAATSG